MGCNGISGSLGADWTLRLGFHGVNKRHGFSVHSSETGESMVVQSTVALII